MPAFKVCLVLCTWFGTFAAWVLREARDELPRLVASRDLVAAIPVMVSTFFVAIVALYALVPGLAVLKEPANCREAFWLGLIAQSLLNTHLDSEKKSVRAVVVEVTRQSTD